jgi:endonuclease-3
MNAEKAVTIIKALSGLHPDARPQLNFKSPFQLLVAVILSAQCTDKRVNVVTERLFKVADTAEKMAALPQERLEEIIYSCGLYKSKAKNIIAASKTIAEKFGGKVPDNLKDLQSLSGVGRKTANVVYATAFDKDAIAVDRHVFRVSNRIGLCRANNVFSAERQLMEVIPQNLWSKSHLLLILHGRRICKPKPLCAECGIKEMCDYYINSAGGKN